MKKWSAVFAFLLLLCTVVGCSQYCRDSGYGCERRLYHDEYCI